MKTQNILFKLSAGVYLLLIRHNSVLLLKRFNTRWAAGKYSFISGFIDGNETIKKAALREAKEEVGIEINEKDLSVIHIMHRKSDDSTEYIDFFLTAKRWKGVPKNTEPHKCSQIRWFPITKLPKKIVPHCKKVIMYLQKKTFFSEYGW